MSFVISVAPILAVPMSGSRVSAVSCFKISREPHLAFNSRVHKSFRIQKTLPSSFICVFKHKTPFVSLHFSVANKTIVKHFYFSSENVFNTRVAVKYTLKNTIKNVENVNLTKIIETIKNKFPVFHLTPFSERVLFHVLFPSTIFSNSLSTCTEKREGTQSTDCIITSCLLSLILSFSITLICPFWANAEIQNLSKNRSEELHQNEKLSPLSSSVDVKKDNFETRMFEIPINFQTAKLNQESIIIPNNSESYPIYDIVRPDLSSIHSAKEKFYAVSERFGPESSSTYSKKDKFDPVSEKEREYSQKFEIRVAKAVENLEKAREKQKNGEYAQALDLYSLVVAQDGDLALSSYARAGRAILLYEAGDRAQAILEMEDLSIALKGYPEIHAALAAAFYCDKHALGPAEKQFTLATLLDKRYTDIDWVAQNKHWPPTLIKSLEKFLYLQ